MADAYLEVIIAFESDVHVNEITLFRFDFTPWLDCDR